MPVDALSDTFMGRCVTPVSEDHRDKYGVPSLEELGEKLSSQKRGNVPERGREEVDMLSSAVGSSQLLRTSPLIKNFNQFFKCLKRPQAHSDDP